MVSKLTYYVYLTNMMGTWFLANAAANKFAGTLSALKFTLEKMELVGATSF